MVVEVGVIIENDHLFGQTLSGHADNPVVCLIRENKYPSGGGNPSVADWGAVATGRRGITQGVESLMRR